MDATAKMKYIRMSPRKVRRIADVVRGKKVEQAVVMLKAMPHRAARTMEKILRAAVANAEQGNVRNPEEMVISKALVDPGPMMKRTMARAQGRSNMIRKRTSHITVVLSQN